MKRLLTGVLIAILVPAGFAYGACSDAQYSYCSFGGTVQCQQLLQDLQFSEWDGTNCAAWIGSGWTSYHVNNSSGDDYWQIESWGGSVRQQYTIPADTLSMDMYAVIYLVKSSPGSERIRVQITNTSGTVLQTIGTYYASSSGSTITVNAAPAALAGQTVRLTFTVAPGSTPGDTFFRVTQAYVRAYPF